MSWRTRCCGKFIKLIVALAAISMLITIIVFERKAGHISKDWRSRLFSLNVYGKDLQESNETLQQKDNLMVSNEVSGIESSPMLGPGEMGKPFMLPDNLTDDVKEQFDDGWKKYAINVYASDRISYHRKLPDVRDPWCKEPGRFRTDLPRTDIIIIFYNEPWSLLLRTVHSVLDRTPAHLIGEILLIDDHSDMSHLKKPLDDYFAAYKKVKIIRSPKRIGLIQARILGIKNSYSPVLTFLDAHCECIEGWLEPLLDRIATNSTNVVCPLMDFINESTLEYQSDKFFIGAFDWGLDFSWIYVPERERKRRKHNAEPVRVPAMVGGLFSIDRQYFEHLGYYDPGLDIYGSEHLELSFKTWLCGGTLEVVPCSRVGHIKRHHWTYALSRDGVNTFQRNKFRVAAVWLDDYAKYFYLTIGNRNVDYGDVSERKALRERLQCKNFKWLLENVYPELHVPDNAFAYGEIRNMGFNNKTCLDAPISYVKPVGLYTCHGQGGNQHFIYNEKNEIRRHKACLDFAGKEIKFEVCHNLGGNQHWNYNPDTKQIYHKTFKKCLAIAEAKDKIVMETCEPLLPRTQWLFGVYEGRKTST